MASIAPAVPGPTGQRSSGNSQQPRGAGRPVSERVREYHRPSLSPGLSCKVPRARENPLARRRVDTLPAGHVWFIVKLISPPSGTSYGHASWFAPALPKSGTLGFGWPFRGSTVPPAAGTRNFVAGSAGRRVRSRGRSLSVRVLAEDPNCLMFKGVRARVGVPKENRLCKT